MQYYEQQFKNTNNDNNSNNHSDTHSSDYNNAHATLVIVIKKDM